MHEVKRIKKISIVVLAFAMIITMVNMSGISYVSADTPEETLEEIPEEITEETSEVMPEEVLEETSEVITEEVPEVMPEGMLEETPEAMQEGILEETPEETPEVMPEGAATGIPITDFITDQYLRYYFSLEYYKSCVSLETYSIRDFAGDGVYLYKSDDDYISTSEIEDVKSITIVLKNEVTNSIYTHDLSDLCKFTKVEELTIISENDSRLYVSSISLPASLKKLTVQNVKFTCDVDLTPCKDSLEYLEFTGSTSSCTSLNMQGLTKLKSAKFDESSISAINLTGGTGDISLSAKDCASLTSVTVSGSSIVGTVNLSNCTKLTSVSLNTKTTSTTPNQIIYLKDSPALKTISITQNYYSSTDQLEIDARGITKTESEVEGCSLLVTTSGATGTFSIACETNSWIATKAVSANYTIKGSVSGLVPSSVWIVDRNVGGYFGKKNNGIMYLSDTGYDCDSLNPDVLYWTGSIFVMNEGKAAKSQKHFFQFGDADGNPIAAESIVEIEDPTIVRYDSINEQLIALKQGVTTVTVKSKQDPTVCKSFSVHVSNAIESLNIEKNKIVIAAGGKTKLIKVNVTPEDNVSGLIHARLYYYSVAYNGWYYEDSNNFGEKHNRNGVGIWSDTGYYSNANSYAKYTVSAYETAIGETFYLEAYAKPIATKSGVEVKSPRMEINVIAPATITFDDKSSGYYLSYDASLHGQSGKNTGDVKVTGYYDPASVSVAIKDAVNYPYLSVTPDSGNASVTVANNTTPLNWHLSYTGTQEQILDMIAENPTVTLLVGADYLTQEITVDLKTICDVNGVHAATENNVCKNCHAYDVNIINDSYPTEFTYCDEAITAPASTNFKITKKSDNTAVSITATPVFTWYSGEQSGTYNVSDKLTTEPKAVGTYTLRIQWPGGKNGKERYKDAESKVVVSIVRKTITSTNTDVSVSGTPKAGETLTANVDVDSDLTTKPGTFSYQWYRVNNGVSTIIDGATTKDYVATNADIDKKLKVKVQAFYCDGEVYSELTNTVQRRNSSATITSTQAALSKDWDGTEITAPTFTTSNFAGSPSSEKVSFEYKLTSEATYTTGLPKDAGTYNVRVIVEADDIFEEAISEPVSCEIRKVQATLTSTPSAKKNLIYQDGSSMELINSDGVCVGGTMYYSLTENGTYSSSIPTASLAGNHKVYCKVVGDANHTDSTASAVTVTIGKSKNPSYTVPTNLTGVCGGKLSEVVLPDGFTWTDDTSAVLSADDKEEGSAVTKKAMFTPADTDNYESVSGIEITITVKHDFTDTKTTRTCSYCGLVITLPDDGIPYVKDSSGQKGFTKIEDIVKDTKEGETVTIVMNGEETIPGDIVESIKGKDVTVEIEMDNGIKWSINGKDVSSADIADINLSVTVGTEAGKSIPVEVINEVTGEKTSINLSLAHNGDFGFKATLTVNLEPKNKGYLANLFYFNPKTKKLEYVCAGTIDEDGNAGLLFTHASDYTIVISNKDMNPELDSNKPEAPSATVTTNKPEAPSATVTTNNTTTAAPTDDTTVAPKTGDATPIVWIVVIMMISALAIVVMKKKENHQ